MDHRRAQVAGGSLGLVWNERDDQVDLVRRLDHIVDLGRPDPANDGALERHDVGWTYRLDGSGLVDLAGSRSVAIRLPAEPRAALNTRLRTFFAETANGGATLDVPYITHAFRAGLDDAR